MRKRVITPDGLTHLKVTYVRLTLCSRSSAKIPLTDTLDRVVTCVCCVAYADKLDAND